jgi:hypothetical protein
VWIPRKVRRAREDFAVILDLVAESQTRSGIDAELRKSQACILWDLLSWRIRHSLVPKLYFACGLDRKGARMDRLDGLERLKALRRRLNYPPTDWRRFNYIAVLRDKHLFTLFAVDRGHPIPRTLAYLDAHTLQWTDEHRAVSLDRIADRSPIDGFAKPVVGIWGHGAFPLAVDDRGLCINGQPGTLEEFRTELRGRYLLQERIIQHETVGRLHPASINTLRLVTAMDGEEVRLIGAAMRVGVGGRSVDNWGSGGVIVAVDLEDRCLRGRGVFRPDMGGSVLSHPNTGIAFDCYPIPYIEQALEAVTRFHADIPTIHSIGWDVAMTPAGPLVIEANDHWNIAIHVILDGGFAERFEQICLAAVAVQER